MNEYDLQRLQQTPTGTLIRRFLATKVGDVPDILKYRRAIEKELNIRFHAMDTRYWEDLRLIAISEYNDRKT